LLRLLINIGGQVVAQGKLQDILKCKASPTVQFLSGKRSIETPARRRNGMGKMLTVRGAKENNLKSVDVTFPLGKLIAVTGASGSGKSTLVNEILYKALWKRLVDTRTLPGDHDSIEGADHVHKVVNIDQSRSDATAARTRPHTSAFTTTFASYSRPRRYPSSEAILPVDSVSTSKAVAAKSVRVRA
jgi:excinuclease ABC subunit A